MKFHATRLLVKDFQHSLTFYRDVLGFSGWHDDTMEYAYFEEQQLTLFVRARMAGMIGERIQTSFSPSQFILQFEVDDVDAVFERLQAKGIHFLTHPTDKADWRSRVAHFRDPDDNVIELYKPIRK